MNRRHLLKHSVALGGLGLPGGAPKGYGMSNEIPDRAEAEGAVRVVEELFSRFTSISA